MSGSVLAEYFPSVELGVFKTGFLYRRVAAVTAFKHKMLFVCRNAADEAVLSSQPA